MNVYILHGKCLHGYISTTFTNRACHPGSPRGDWCRTWQKQGWRGAGLYSAWWAMLFAVNGVILYVYNIYKINMYIYTYMYTSIYLFTYSEFTCSHVHMFTCSHVHMFTYIHTYIHTYTHTDIQTYRHTHTYQTYRYVHLRRTHPRQRPMIANSAPCVTGACWTFGVRTTALPIHKSSMRIYIYILNFICAYMHACICVPICTYHSWDLKLWTSECST